MLDKATKNNLRIFGTFLGMCVVMTGILVLAIVLSKSSKSAFLAADMQRVLDQYEPNGYTVGKEFNIKSSFATSAAAYSLDHVGEGAGEQCTGIIIRIPTLFGPMPAVFIYAPEKPVVFAGYAVDTAKATELDTTLLSKIIFNYWKKTIPKILARREADERQ